MVECDVLHEAILFKKHNLKTHWDFIAFNTQGHLIWNSIERISSELPALSISVASLYRKTHKVRNLTIYSP